MQLKQDPVQLESIKDRPMSLVKDLKHMGLQGKTEGLFSLEMRRWKGYMIAAFL